MTTLVVYYAPGAGGNHLKNLICLDTSVTNHTDLHDKVYEPSRDRPLGAVHSSQGRNIQPVQLEKILGQPDQLWVICGHFGELAPRQALLDRVPNKRFITIGIESPNDRWLLEKRNQRLGQKCHPYWLHEEQPYLYQSHMIRNYFGCDYDITIALEHFWHPDLAYHTVIDTMNRSMGLSIDKIRAQELHDKWWDLNFGTEWTQDIRDFYDQKKNN